MASRPSQRQMEALVEFLERNPGIAKGLLRTQHAKVETRRKWQESAIAANAMGGVSKDGPAWSKYWAEKKCALKRQCQQRAQSIRRTGGGVDMLPEPSQLELRLVAVMGGHSFATGDRGLAVDPFPHSSLQQSLSMIIDHGPQPSTSQAAIAQAEVMNFEIAVEEEQQVQNPPQLPTERVEGSHQEDGIQAPNRQGVPFHVQSATRRVQRDNQQGRQGCRASFLNTTLARFEEIESRRVESERQTAQALEKNFTAMSDIAHLLSDYLEIRRREE